YLSRTDVPGHLSTLRTVAHETPNYALLCRWAAALAEMRSFHNASPEIRDEVLRKLAAGIREALDESSVVEIVESPYSRVPKPDHRGLDELPTIFTFLVRKPDGEFMTYTETREVYSLLGRDLSGKLGPSEPAVLHRAFQLGQPVKVKYEGDQAFWGASYRDRRAHDLSRIVRPNPRIHLDGSIECRARRRASRSGETEPDRKKRPRGLAGVTSAT